MARAESPRQPAPDIFSVGRRFIQPHLDTLQERLKNPDSVGESEKYFAAISHPEKKQFLIDEIVEASRVLTGLSYDFENHTDFYNTASDKELKKHILDLVFPEAARKETQFGKMKRVARELSSGRPEKPNPLVRTGASAQWRRRVMRAIDILLDERRQMAKIAEYWDDPFDDSREAFHEILFFGHQLQGTPEVSFTPFAMIIALDDNDYDQVTSNLTHDPDRAQETYGMAVTRHTKFPELSGRVTFIRKAKKGEEDYFKKMVRHELFHLYFHSFIRKQRLSKVNENQYSIKRVQTLEEASSATREITTDLESTILEETAAYLFNTDSVTNVDKASGYFWESHVQSLKDSFPRNSLESRTAVEEARKAQATYLKRARRLQSSVTLLFEEIAQKNDAAALPLTPGEVRRNFLFFLSQWGPTRMDQLVKRLGFDESKLENEEEKADRLLQTNVHWLLHALRNNQILVGTETLLSDVISEGSWLYAADNLLTFLQMCGQVLRKMGVAQQHHALIRIIENTIVVRQQPLSDDEERELQEVISLASTHRHARIRRDSKTLRKYLEEFST